MTLRARRLGTLVTAPPIHEGVLQRPVDRADFDACFTIFPWLDRATEDDVLTNECRKLEQMFQTWWHALNTTTAIPNMDIPEDFSCFMRLYIVTIQRPCEIARMDARQLNLERGLWRVPQGIKGGRHIIPLSPIAVSLIRRAIAIREGFDSGAVFPACRNAKGETSVDVMVRRFRQVATALSSTDLRLHDIRHAGRVLLQDRPMRVPVEAAARALGHRKKGIEEIYAGGGDRLHEKRKVFQAWKPAWATLPETTG